MKTNTCYNIYHVVLSNRIICKQNSCVLNSNFSFSVELCIVLQTLEEEHYLISGSDMELSLLPCCGNTEKLSQHLDDFQVSTCIVSHICLLKCTDG